MSHASTTRRPYAPAAAHVDPASVAVSTLPTYSGRDPFRTVHPGATVTTADVRDAVAVALGCESDARPVAAR